MSEKQMGNRQNRIGVWLYFENAIHEKVAAYLQNWQPSPYWGQIQGVRVNPAVASRIIPGELQEGAESWLVLYRANLAQELLVLPFPEPDNASILNEPKTFGSYLSGLLEYVQGGNHNWYPYNGFRNLIEYIKREKAYTFPHPSPPQRFQVVRHYKTIEELLQRPELHYEDEEQRETATVFTRASQHIQQNRDHLLVSLITAQNEEQIRELLENFEMALLEEGDRLSELVGREIPTIVEKFESVMDDETKIFLISAEAVARFARRQLSGNFDFSLCGCGLWKAIERELNSSLIWHLRLGKGIAGKDREPIAPPSRKGINYEAGSETVNIDRRERGSAEFEGVTLGKFKYLLRSSRDNDIAKEIGPALTGKTDLLRFVLDSGKGGLAQFIGQVASIRNGNAHIKAMQESSYQDLHLLVLEPNNKPAESLLGKVLEIKRAIADYWHRC